MKDECLETAIVALARLTASLFPDTPWRGFLDRWLSNVHDRDEALVSEFHLWTARWDELVVPATNVEGYVVGSARNLSLRDAHLLLGWLAFEDEDQARLHGEAWEIVRGLRKRLGQVERDRNRKLPTLYAGETAKGSAP